MPPNHVASSLSIQDPIRFESPRTIRYGVGDAPAGWLDDYGGKLLGTLVADSELILQLVTLSTPVAPTTEKKTFKNALSLGVIIYGPRYLFSHIGDFMTRAGCYLDDPIGCDRNVPYMNPQYLCSLQEEPSMTFELSQLQHTSVENFSRASLDVLSGFETTDDFDLSDTPTALRTKLKIHQRQALTFLLRREKGKHPTKDGLGIWLRKVIEGQTTFANAVTDEAQPTPGPLWRGGLLADEMGLGKTLSMIALIASDQDYDSSNRSTTGHSTFGTSTCSTLIVVPPTLFGVWESQLRTHLHDGKLKWFTHHGKQRLKLDKNRRPPEIVFTTYQTLEREYRKGAHSILSHHWRRIILDEAHMIRNHNTSTSQAVAALRATSRWAVSGTPIQNSLLDLLGLLKFLHFSPYDEPKVFDKDISNIWRVKPVDEAAETFKELLSCFMIRRTKAMLNLPSVDDRLVNVPFSHEERNYYRQIEQPVVEMLDRRAESGGHAHVPWMTAIQQINKLRLICNLGVFSCFSQPENVEEMTSVMNARYSMDGGLCEMCSQLIEASAVGSGLRDMTQAQAYYSDCSKFYCARCAEDLSCRSPDPCACTGQSRSCQLRPLASVLPTPRLTPVDELSPSPTDLGHISSISSKVWALISQIKSRPQEKHVVFSFWTSSLDMVEAALQCDPNHIIPSVRIDGKVDPKIRSHVIQKLHDDSKIRVILITINCGACGLDLTAASTIHLLEPEWNPSLEDQALARVHRIGQTRPVTTIRYVMEDSFEEQVLKIQDRKKLLASTLLSNGSSLENLRHLLHERKYLEV
ncbi:unnamed protein product [Alternaria alternata]